MDPRLQQLSYSSLLKLHSCPRKLQLDRLNADGEDKDLDGSGNVTFAYGHIVGEGIQRVLEGKTEEEVIWKMFLGWHADLADENVKQRKSFYLAVIAVQKFVNLAAQGLLQDYELVYYEGKPATELSFIVYLPNGFKLRGFVDAVLRHRISGAILVLECKTSSATSLNAATYKNSAQAIGYSIVLDVLFPELSSYEVLYLVYMTKAMEYEALPFTKSYLQRALWIQELLLDIETIELYERVGVYPMRGESCYSFYRECEYINLCSMSTSHLTKKLTPEIVEEIEESNSHYQIKLQLSDLINAQIEKTS